ncbi:MAG: hypothetical protein ACOCX9_03960, partial [Spirochaetota bacterium]
EFLHQTHDGLHCAVSPLEPQVGAPLLPPRTRLLYSSLAGTLQILLYPENISETIWSQIEHYLEDSHYQREVIISFLRKREFKSTLSHIHADEFTEETGKVEHYSRLSFSFLHKKEMGILTMYVPHHFIRLISSQKKSKAGHSMEESMKAFFRNTGNVFPSLRLLLQMFNDRELQKLLFHLHTKNLLSTYQLCILVRAFPSHALRVKHNLSKNMAGDVIDMMKQLEKKGGLSRRDLQAGVYSIEEALFMLLRQDEPVAYSRFLHNMQQTLTMIRCVELLEMKPFIRWLENMMEDRLLYDTVATLPDAELYRAFDSGDSEILALLRQHISGRKLSDILSPGTAPASPAEVQMSRCLMIRTYRHLWYTRSTATKPGLNFIKIMNDLLKPEEVRYVLYDTGWFVLSTALKGMSARTVQMYMPHLPSGARYLVEDVLHGILNPNILHDESQIRHARERCASRIINLHEEGIIHLQV